MGQRAGQGIWIAGGDVEAIQELNLKSQSCKRVGVEQAQKVNQTVRARRRLALMRQQSFDCFLGTLLAMETGLIIEACVYRQFCHP